MDIFLVEDPELNFFPQLGIPIHGIIGKDFFEDFVVEVNYFKRFIRFYEHDEYPNKRRKRYNISELRILSDKPYFGVSIKNQDKVLNLNLLLDTGMSDALWLVQDDKLQKPSKKFYDYLGRSITGNVFGDRAKVNELDINSFKFSNIITAFPDSTSTRIPNVKNKFRNGVIGGEILKRFNCLIDYKNKEFGLKKNSNFSTKFSYNVSGLELYYDGYSIFKDYKEAKAASPEKVIFVSRIGVIYKPTVKILNVRKDSPAYRVGLQKDDIIVSINKNSSHNYDLAELNYIINDFEKGKTIRLKVERQGKEIVYEFAPKDIL
ncbi:MAG: PDZ domain-containing protein [Flavobacteriaceae bacterium]|nr:PDZ domain-containing protein [Flavobacteriaceae bacterium]